MPSVGAVAPTFEPRTVDAATLVIGEPKVDSALAALRPGKVQRFAEGVSQDTGNEAIGVTPEQ